MSATATAAATPTPTKYQEYGRPLWQRVFMTREMAIIALLVLTLIVAGLTIPHFADRLTTYNLLRDMFASLIIALPMALVMITGDIDISMVGLSCSLLGLLFAAGVPFELAMVIVLVMGAAGGLLNGVLTAKVGLPSLAVTIGTMALFRGIAVGLLGTSTITGFPKGWTNLTKYEIGHTGIPFIMVFYLVLFAAFVYLLNFTPFGRGIYAIGLNSEAAVFSGINRDRTRIILFVLAGMLSALGGIYWTLLRSTARGDIGDGLELQVIAAVVLGGVSVFGGIGSLWGVVAGVLLIGALSSALRLVGVTAEVIKIITGVLLIGSVVAASMIATLKNRRKTVTSA